jgi:hypothetical protein
VLCKVLIAVNARTITWFLVILISVNIVPIGYAINSIYGQASFSGNQPVFVQDANRTERTVIPITIAIVM